MNSSFKDHFSDASDDYRSFRPRYPAELYAYLSGLCAAHGRAWDCATGTGQAAAGLAAYFAEVIATDASRSQIESAQGPDNVRFRVAQAEQSGIDSRSLDLVTVAQALHWFDLDAFRREVDRVLKPGGVLAVWIYGMLTIDQPVDERINYLYGPVLDDYWPAERRFIEQGYRQVEFPYPRVESPEFEMVEEWKLSQLLGYLNTWSAVKRFEQANTSNPVQALAAELVAAWGDPKTIKKTVWPLTVLLWRKPDL
jgi:SAM-dependent methyltransferase